MGAAASLGAEITKDQFISMNGDDQEELEKFHSCAIDGVSSRQTLIECFGSDTFLTHDWGQELGLDNHARVSKVNLELQNRKLKTWFDSDKLHGNIKKQIINGLDRTSCICVFITKRYMDKVCGNNAGDFCQLEFEYAARTKTRKKMIPIEGYQ